MDKNLELFAKKLRKIRKKRGYTLEKLAEMVEVSPNHIQKIEGARTNPSFPLISKLAFALNIELKEFFNFDDLRSKNYIKDEFNKLLKYSDESHLQILYKIHRDLIN
ncbi:helix-turn-helix transcriptional regulator [bacterium]|nr:helix-turn-helix transcriptional regulator [bacterium]